MIKCDCNERVGIEINSYQLFEDLKAFFNKQVKKRTFLDIPVTEPYFCGYNLKPEDVKDEYKWYANKWYECKCCGTLWEFVYPDFPTKGFVRKFEDGIYHLKDQENSVKESRGQPEHGALNQAVINDNF